MKTRKRRDDAPLKTVLDPRNPAFERQDNVVYKPGEGSHIYPNPQEYPEVKEYMAWRLKRNKKRLQRLEFAVRRLCGNQNFTLNRRVVLHAIARRLLDGVAMLVPRLRREMNH